MMNNKSPRGTSLRFAASPVIAVSFAIWLLCELAHAQGAPLAKEAPTQLNVPRRISSKIMDLGHVYPISMVAGMATLIELPGPVTGIRTGDPDSVHYIRPEKPENEVTIVLQNQGARPTNLILRSGKRKFVFDIVPSKTLHQDVLEVAGSYGGAELDSANAELIDSSDTSPLPREGSK